MTAAPKVIDMICPSCEGNGRFMGAEFPCMWCHGYGRVQTAVALRYADTVHMLAGGGYIAGDHSLADCRALERKADAVYALARRTPPWSNT